ncbi:MAG: tyrosine-type recombinase/integrase, partial [Burkholderiales bacterium]
MPEKIASAQKKKIRTPDDKRKLITKSDADKALPASDNGTPYFILEETTPGFGLRVGARTKSWMVRRKFMGMTRRLTIGSYPVLMPDEARKKAKQFLGMMENAVDPKEEIEKRKREYAAKKTFHSWTLETLWPLYLAKSRENPHSENTKKSYVNGEKRLKGSSFWKVPIATMTADHVRAGYDHLLKTTNSKRSNNGGKTTAAQVMRYARAVLRFGLEKKLGGKYPDPFESIDDDDRWKQPEPKSGTVIDAEGDLARWWASVESLRQKTDPRAADAPTLADYLILSLLWGGRKTEMLTLEWASVDFNAGSVAFEAEKTKSKRRHLIPLAPFARSILERRWQARETLPAEKRSAYLFQASRIGFMFKQQPAFERGIAELKATDPLLADYLEKSRQTWSERLIKSRIDLEHNNWSLPRVTYDTSGANIVAVEPFVAGQPVTEFVQAMLDRVCCFVENVTAHCIQQKMAAPITITEVPLAKRRSEAPERFQLTLAVG